MEGFYKKLISAFCRYILVIFLLSLFLRGKVNAATNYYFDSINGIDNISCSSSAPCKSLSKMNSLTYTPGDNINLKRGSFWDGLLQISQSGTEGSPITFKAYGEGNAPIFQNTHPADITWSNTVQIGKYVNGGSVGSSWIVIQDLLVKNAPYGGIAILLGSNHNIIQNNEITQTGVGIPIEGQYNAILRNNIHDLHMVHNDNDNGDDDFGAVAIWMFNANNEVAYNKILNCEAPSYDYGMDGGAVEIYVDTNLRPGSSGDNNKIHHNWSMNTEGFMEVSSRYGSTDGRANNVKIYYNVIINAKGLNDIHLVDGFKTSISNFRVENNTIIDRRPYSPLKGSVIWFNGTNIPSDYPVSNYIFQNNIVYIRNYNWISYSSSNRFTHKNNLYYLEPHDGTAAQVGFTLDPSERLVNPLFTFIDLRTDQNNAAHDLHLTSQSTTALDKGLPLGYIKDFEDKTVGTIPDIGAYEYGTGSTPPPCTKQGDADGDCVVNETDYGIWLSHYNQSISGVSNGNFNNDNVVDGADYIIWFNNL